ncbi:hypothetical protein M501DRAFT_507905 [Patellaria atrata CBS 101060]|uniref:Uncharacterized protein n=1 Tax=Patellaria atrata CBS 101060 TaxID=1346257 RepID=A0A9P4S244_9PEZI|nr:hypothetical protein M501DRAFT_507905 [Patellaria atrata CBS 101060]
MGLPQLESLTNLQIIDHARDRLLHIAVVMQAEIIRSLQIAVKYENALLDLTILHEASVTNRYDTMTTLDQLRQRILMAGPIERPIHTNLEVPRKPSMESIRTFMTAHTVASDFVPQAVTIPVDVEKTSTLSRIMSRRRQPISRPDANPFELNHNAHVHLRSNLNWLLPAIRHDDRDFSDALLGDFQSLQIDNKDFGGDGLHGRQNSTSTRDSYSDKVPSRTSFAESSGSISPLPNTPTSVHNPTFLYPSTQISPDGAPTTPAFTTRRRSDFRNSTIMMVGSGQPLIGRPSKENGYWGFCKGSWSMREEVHKGLNIQYCPDGMYSTLSYWKCRECTFQGPAFGQKPYYVDPKIYTASCGIQYKWIFLAKSHVKKKGYPIAPGKFMHEEYNYGCMFCCVEGRTTGIFGNSETLMNHVFMEHRSLSHDVAERTRCIIGDPVPGKPFDIIIPAMPIEDVTDT